MFALIFSDAEQAQVEAAAHSLSVAARLLGMTETWHQRFIYALLPRERQEGEECIAAKSA